MFTNVG